MKLETLNKQLDIQDAYSPSKSDISKVGRILGPDRAKEVGIYRAVVSNNKVDRDGDQFGYELLFEMASQYENGRTVVIASHQGFMGVGRTFEADVQKQEDGHYDAVVKFYISPSAQFQAGPAKALMDDRVYNRVSIAMQTRVTRFIDDGEGKEVRYFNEPEGTIVRHLAIVDMGANVGAVMKQMEGTKSSLEESPRLQKNKTMKYNIEILSLDKEASFEHADDSLKDMIKELDKKVQTANSEKSELLKRIEEYEKKEEELVGKTLTEYIETWKQLNSGFSQENLEEEEAIAKALSTNPALLEKKLKASKSKLIAIKQKQITPNPPSPAPEKPTSSTKETFIQRMSK